MNQMDYIIGTRLFESFHYVTIGQQDALRENVWLLHEYQIGLN